MLIEEYTLQQNNHNKHLENLQAKYEKQLKKNSRQYKKELEEKNNIIKKYESKSKSNDDQV